LRLRGFAGAGFIFPQSRKDAKKRDLFALEISD
jgi:hypothetical protein